MALAEKICIFAFLLQSVCCRDFSISLPEKIEALNGSCVIIKCRFEINDDAHFTEKDAIGFWLKNNNHTKNEVFNSKGPKPNNFEGKMSEKLHEKNCTTIFYNVSSKHNGTYIFRIESGSLNFTYTDNTSMINVIESPVKPRVQLYEEQKEQQEPQEVLEGRSVSLSCSAEALCSSPPATLTWSSTPRILLSESSKLQELIISDLNFTASRRHHNVTFTCSISYQDNNKTANSSITLHVQYAPQISNSSSCTGTEVPTYFCEVDGNPSPEVQWLLSGCPVSNSSDTFISEERLSSTGLRSFISLNQSLTNTFTVMCVGRNTYGCASQQLHLNVISKEASWFSIYSFMTGVAVGVVLLIVFVSALLYQLICKTQGDNKTALSQIDGAVSQDNGADPIYVNEVMMSSARAATLGSLYKEP